jgi:rSAM/selenodomain-associated transferase 1
VIAYPARKASERRRPHLVVMARRPQAGRVKTRLARDVGEAEALRFYRRQLGELRRTLARSRRWRTIFALAPDRGKSPPELALAGGGGPDAMRQGGGDIGERMERILLPGAAAAACPLVIVGSDIPGVRPAMIAHAFDLLKSHDFVFGPALDGGFWMVGASPLARRLAAGMFEGVRWSSPCALADCLARLKGRSAAMTACLRDVDNGADYAAFLKQ